MFTKRLFTIKLHTRRVLITRRTLPVLAFMLASLMLAWPSLIAEHKEQFSAVVKTDQKSIGAKVDMEKVRFYSQDAQKQPLTVTAPKILETDSVNQIVTLYKPVATYEMSSGALLTSKTSHGLYYQEKNHLFLEDTVTTTTEDGYKAISKKVWCYNELGEIVSDEPITATGPTGTLDAQGFKIYNKADNIDFKKKTDTTIYEPEGNVRIRSNDGLNVDQKEQKLTAIKDVVVTQQDKKITADKMVLYYYTKKQNPNERVKEIEAFGHVVATSPGEKITGEHGIYNPKKGTIVMDQNVILYHGESYIEGETATLDLNSGESTIVPKKGTNSKKNRIQGKLLPADIKGEKHGK